MSFYPFLNQKSVLPPVLVQNAVWVPELELYFRSSSSHDFVMVELPDGKFLYIDGGRSYVRRGGDLELLGTRIFERCLYDCDPIERMADYLLWGTFGQDGAGPFKLVLLKDCSTEHLQAIKETQPQANYAIKKVVNYLLDQRAKSAILSK